jgi:diguanylate cyclase (GGDEF)-like protein
MVWASNGVVQTAGDLGSEVSVTEETWPNLAELGSPAALDMPPGSDWCYGFPLQSGDERVGTMVMWGVGKAPDLGFAQSVVTPLLDLGSLAIIRSRELSNLNHRATTDHVTGLLNRHAFFYALDQMVERSAVIYVDLDGFKAINDQFGHTIGDRLLLAVAHRLSAAVTDRGSVGRLGGDEFAIACIGVSEQEVRGAAQTASDALNQLIELDGHQVVSGASLGVAYSEHLICGKRLIDIADQALLVAKAVGKGGVHMVTVDADVAST